MDEICTECGQPIVSQYGVKLIDGYYSSDGEFDPQNTETYDLVCFASKFRKEF